MTQSTKAIINLANERDLVLVELAMDCLSKIPPTARAAEYDIKRASSALMKARLAIMRDMSSS